MLPLHVGEAGVEALPAARLRLQQMTLLWVGVSALRLLIIVVEVVLIGPGPNHLGPVGLKEGVVQN